MPRQRHRKIPVAKSPEAIKENEEKTEEKQKLTNSMVKIIEKSQLGEALHKKLHKELLELYKTSEFDIFMEILIALLSNFMEKSNDDPYVTCVLSFICKFVTSFGDDISSPNVTTFKWLLSTNSSSTHLKFRICQFINMMLTSLGLEASLDDCICDSILIFMINLLKDTSSHVRAQAVYALQRLQNPELNDDVVVKHYLMHLKADPAPKVRQAVVSVIGRNVRTINDIQERLWDVDENVRKHTYMQMTSYPVKAYRVTNRLVFLEQGLNDNSKNVRKIVTNLMLPQWLESYNKNYITLIAGLKLDGHDIDIARFQKTARITLLEIFKNEKMEDLIDALELHGQEKSKNRDDEEDDDDDDDVDEHEHNNESLMVNENNVQLNSKIITENFKKCVLFKNLTLEMSVYWMVLVEHFHLVYPNEIDLILPDLTTFCQYIKKFYETFHSHSSMDPYQKIAKLNTLYNLIEIITYFDYTDEIGKNNLKTSIQYLLNNCDIKEKSIRTLVKVMETIIVDKEERFQYFIDIINNMIKPVNSTIDFIHDRMVTSEILDKSNDTNLQIKLSSLKVNMMELCEQATNFNNSKNYRKAQEFTEKLNTAHMEYYNVLQQLNNSLPADKRITIPFPSETPALSNAVITKSLQIAFFMVASENVNSLTINACQLYNDFIRRHMESSYSEIRDWALQCGTAFSLLYESFVLDVFEILYKQFYSNAIRDLWTTSVRAVFELLDKYGFKYFGIEDRQNKTTQNTGRQLFKTNDALEQEDDENSSTSGVDLMSLMMHFLDTCQENSVSNAIIEGYCRLCLHGHYTLPDVVSKLIIKYFNPSTDVEGNQILGIFFKTLIQNRKQEYLVPALLTVVYAILEAPHESPLSNVKPEEVIKFVVRSTQSQFCRAGLNIHDTIAMTFLEELFNKITNKEMAKIISKELLLLEISDDDNMRNEMKILLEKILEQQEFDLKTVKSLEIFQDVLDRKKRDSLTFSSTKLPVSMVKDEGDLENIIEDPSEMGDNTNDAIETIIPPSETTETIISPSETTEIVENQSKNTDEQAEKVVQPVIVPVTKIEQIITDFDETTGESVVAPEAPESERELSCTPTTYGLNNSTNLKSLRKSLNSNSNGYSTSSSPVFTTRKNKKIINGGSDVDNSGGSNRRIMPARNKKKQQIIDQDNSEMEKENTDSTEDEHLLNKKKGNVNKKLVLEKMKEKEKEKIIINKEPQTRRSQQNRRDVKEQSDDEIPATQINNNLLDKSLINKTQVEISESDSSISDSQDSLNTIPSTQRTPPKTRRKAAAAHKENDIVPLSPNVLPNSTLIARSSRKGVGVKQQQQLQLPILTKTIINSHDKPLKLTPTTKLKTLNVIISPLRSSPRIKSQKKTSPLRQSRTNTNVVNLTEEITTINNNVTRKKRSLNTTTSEAKFLTPERTNVRSLRESANKNQKEQQTKSSSSPKTNTNKKILSPPTTPIMMVRRKSKRTMSPRKSLDTEFIYSPIRKQSRKMSPEPTNLNQVEKELKTPTKKLITSPKLRINATNKSSPITKLSSPLLVPTKIKPTKIPIIQIDNRIRRSPYVPLKRVSSEVLAKSLKAKTNIFKDESSKKLLSQKSTTSSSSISSTITTRTSSSSSSSSNILTRTRVNNLNNKNIKSSIPVIANKKNSVGMKSKTMTTTTTTSKIKRKIWK